VKPRIKIAKADNQKPWSVKDSVFRDYKKEDEELWEKCFKFDWNSSRIPRFIKDERELQIIHDHLRSLYRAIKDTYKYFAAIGVSGDLFSVPINAFTEFLNQAGIVDGKLIKLSEIDILFITTNAVSVKQPFNPDRALVRYQFMEILVRIAVDKYVKQKVCATPSEALKLLLDGDVLKVLSVYNTQDWRETKLWNHKCDLVFKSYMPILKDIYHRYSGQKTKPGMRRFMCLEELRRFCNDCELFGETFQDREVTLAYNFSIMLQIDELNSDRHMQMYFTEFIEAFARIADKCALAPYFPKVDDLDFF